MGFRGYLVSQSRLSQGPFIESNNDFVVLYFLHVLDFFSFSKLDNGPYL